MAASKPPLRPTSSARTPSEGGARATLLPQPVAELRLINGFDLLRDGVPVRLPRSVQRLLALLAFSQKPLERVYVAGTLWINAAEERALANLRSALWRANKHAMPLVSTESSRLGLAPGIRVDLHAAADQARCLVDGSAGDDVTLDSFALAGELLPDWYEDWVVLERELYRQLRLHALEALATRLTARRRFGDAAEAALTAIADEPLRESAHRTLIRVYLVEGNPSEALRHYEQFRVLLDERLGLAPSPKLQELVAEVKAKPDGSMTISTPVPRR